MPKENTDHELDADLITMILYVIFTVLVVGLVIFITASTIKYIDIYNALSL